jgi:tetratricopeptide (TPR) repeat protein
MPAEFRRVPIVKVAADTLDPQAQFHQALALYRAGQLVQAQALCESVIKTQPEHIAAIHVLGTIAYRTGNYLKALDLIGKVIDVYPNNADLHANRGDALQELRQFDAAVASYDRAIALRPAFADAYHARGNALQKLDRQDAAIASYDRAIALNPGLPTLYCSRGNSFVMLKQPDNAVASYDKAIALKPDFAAAYNSRGVALQELNQLDAAIASYDRAIALQPNVAGTFYNRGNALQELEQLDAAVASYDRAIALAPDFTDAHYHRGNALVKLKRLDEALSSYATVMKLDPEHIEVRKTLLRHSVSDLINPSLIEQLGKDLADRNLKHELANLYANKVISDFRVRHDLEQTGYLLALGHECEGLREANGRLQDAYARRCLDQSPLESSGKILLSEEEAEDIARFRKQLLRYQMPGVIDSCLNPEIDWSAIEDQYFASNPEIIHIDNFLSRQALLELRKFCLISTIWKTEYVNQYLGAFAENGFVSPLHLQIAKELQAKMPRIFGDHMLEQLWAFKYDSQMDTGINVHADFARVNLNFWITPDDANLDPASGGLVVYDVPSPPSWGFEEYNTDQESIYAFLEKSGAGRRTIPYKCNRAVLFNSSLFHETDRMRFKAGYENRRINITYLFGVGLR